MKFNKLIKKVSIKHILIIGTSMLFIPTSLFLLGKWHFQTLSYQFSIRPYWFIPKVNNSQLKHDLWACRQQALRPHTFSIAHRGASMQFPEHTLEAYLAAAHQGASAIECDVTFTKDKELVCRHAQDDLHFTTNILATPLAAKCTQKFQPAILDTQGNIVKPAQAECRTSDLTLAEFKSLKGKITWQNPKAQNIQEYMYPPFWQWRTHLFSHTGTLMSHAESIQLFKQLNKKMIPELKHPKVSMPFNDFTYDMYRQKIIDEYAHAQIPAHQVFLSSDNLDTLDFWLKIPHAYQAQIAWVDNKWHLKTNANNQPLPLTEQDKKILMQQKQQILSALKAKNIHYIQSPIVQLYDNLHQNGLAPSEYTKALNHHQFKVFAWTLEKSLSPQVDTMTLIDDLIKNKKVEGIFSDWVETVTYYGNCFYPDKNIQ